MWNGILALTPCKNPLLQFTRYSDFEQQLLKVYRITETDNPVVQRCETHVMGRLVFLVPAEGQNIVKQEVTSLSG